jgi:NAD(P)-dependent dehydrogenase (short-subunit alcohol dehydrogenase family)
MHVFMCSRKAEAMSETADLIHRLGGRASWVVADMSEPEQIANVYTRLREETDTLDVLVHNAAVMGGGPMSGTDPQTWHYMMATNADSAYYLSKYALEMMLPRKSGNLIFISTVGVAHSHYNQVSYDASKGALEAFARALAVEVAPNGIRVNVIAPGPIRGRLEADVPDLVVPFDDFKQPLVPMGRNGTALEIAAPVAFLASEQSSYITGQVITVDGGVTSQLVPPGHKI